MNLSGAEAGQARAQLATLAENPRTDTTGGLVDVPAWLERCQVYAWILHGRRLLTFALQRDVGPGVVLCAAIGGDPRAPIASRFLDQLEGLLAGRVLTIETRRRGLVRLLERRGYLRDSAETGALASAQMPAGGTVTQTKGRQAPDSTLRKLCI